MSSDIPALLLFPQLDPPFLQHINGQCRNHDDAHNDPLDISGEVQLGEACGQNAVEQNANDAAPNGALAAGDGYAAQQTNHAGGSEDQTGCNGSS